MLIPWQQANVVINVTQEEKVLVRLTDYDLASIWSDSDQAIWSDSDQAMETYTCFRWQAPEVLTNVAERLPEPTDVFSFAMLAVEVFTGNHPFPDIKGINFALAILAGNRPARPKNIPDDVWELVEKCWNDNPGARPEIGDVVKRLETVQGNLPSRDGFDSIAKTEC